ncbi:hypothetical protein DFS34DRAFT_590451 [Phlyctochytrium arcticum]|nr:hypothetical protein DFS34DRAFT_590451 [Phlyctochytrium arcticum]
MTSGGPRRRVERERQQGPSLTISHREHDETFAVNLFCLRTSWLDSVYPLPRMLPDVPDSVNERRVLLNSSLERFEEDLLARATATTARRTARAAEVGPNSQPDSIWHASLVSIMFCIASISMRKHVWRSKDISEHS